MPNTKNNKSKTQKKQMVEKKQKGGVGSLKKQKSIKQSIKQESTKGKIFKNIRYTKGSKVIPELKCDKCNANQFKVRTLTMGSKTKSFFDMEFFDNRFKVFTCVSCGHVEIFSNNITCDGDTCDKSMW